MSSAQLTYLLVFLGFLIAMIAVGIIVSRKVNSGEDFLMGGRGLTTPLLIGTTLATLVGTGSSMGAVGFGFSNGWGGALYGIGGALGMFLLLLLFADVRKYNFMTFSEELSFYYGANKFVKGLTSIILYVACIGWLGAHIIGGSLYLSWITGVDPLTAKLIVAVGFGLYTLIGGYLAVVYTDVIQGVILFLGFILLTVLSVIKIGGIGDLNANVSPEMSSFLGLEQIGFIPALSLAVVIAVGVLATPSYRHRIYSSNNERTVRKGFIITGILFALFSFFPAIVGMAANVLNPGLDSGYAFPYLATEVFPIWIGAVVLIAGLSATMSSGSSDFIAAVTILLRDVVEVFTGRLPKKENMVLSSRISLVLTLLLALFFTLFTNNIITYISNFISTVMSGLFIAALLGKFWGRANWQGGIASLIGGSLTSFIILSNESMMAFWGNPILPSLLIALAANVIISLLFPPQQITREESLRLLEEERTRLDEGTTITPTDHVDEKYVK
ncbi:sodium:solute symporter family protein [Halobacillus salinarum]|uniref:Sodium:solute symporter family protein n=1 Tax=Halobacillus salinarum TaxID=2932257 RepID=A0ABY4EI85_9BACI|nr:sodium:solute symporter family protein [Halobacillus salinarum]UOQ44198.1 sodium:solute symporter family protein [Halobacillus salinarum]